MHPSQSTAHAAKRLCHKRCQRSAVSLPFATAASLTQALASGWPWDLLGQREPRKWSCRSLPGKGICVLCGEGSVLLMLLVKLDWLCFPAALSPAKGLITDLCSVNSARQIRILQCPTLHLHIVEMTSMCSVNRLTAIYARNNAGSSGFRSCSSCWVCAAW